MQSRLKYALNRKERKHVRSLLTFPMAGAFLRGSRNVYTGERTRYHRVQGIHRNTCTRVNRVSTDEPYHYTSYTYICIYEYTYVYYSSNRGGIIKALVSARFSRCPAFLPFRDELFSKRSEGTKTRPRLTGKQVNEFINDDG